MMFAATFSSGAFDRRLSMAGYPRGALALAKIACLVVASLVVCSYATAVICCYWSPRQPVLLAAPLFGAAMTYGGVRRKRAGRAGRFPSAHPLVSSAQDVDPPPRTSHRRTAYYRTDGDRTTGEAVRVTVADQ
ncbi:hypothetical protein ACWDSF_28215 [Nocardia beijingensis]